MIDRLESGLRAARVSVDLRSALLDYIEASSPDAAADSQGPSGEAAAAALGRVGTSAVPAGPSATFLEMVSTGDLSIIRNEALRDALFEYDLSASSNRDSWRVLRQAIVEEQRIVFSYFEAEFDSEGEELSLIVTGFQSAPFLADARCACHRRHCRRLYQRTPVTAASRAGESGD